MPLKIDPRVFIMLLEHKLTRMLVLLSAYQTIDAFDVTIQEQLSYTSDIRLYNKSLIYELGETPTDMEFSFTFKEATMDYEPQAEAFGETSRSIDEKTYSFVTTLNHRWGEMIRTSIQGSLEEGYSDYRSIWIDEYYRQVFSELGYLEPDPYTLGVGFGIQWEWVPANRFLNFDLNYARSVIAPGYERDITSFPFTTIRDNDELDRLGMALGIETILSRRARLKAEVMATHVTDRDSRFGFRLVHHYALLNHLVFKTEGSYVVEGSEFEALAFQANLEFDYEDCWFYGFTARFYEDTGEFEDSITVSSAAPALKAYRAGLTLSYHGERSAMRVYIGPYWSDYESASISNVVPFQNLYQDRDWFQVEFLYRLRF